MKATSLSSVVGFLAFVGLLSMAEAFQSPSILGLSTPQLQRAGASLKHGARVPVPLALRMTISDEDQKKVKDVEEVTKKYGLEAGVFTAITSKDKKGPDAKELLKKYGSAYLLTSISLALVSFSICYVLVDNGVDVNALLAKVGIEGGGKAETAGTAAIAYAAHKAASPIRFPPTVALTPLTAKYLFNKEVDEEDSEKSD